MLFDEFADAVNAESLESPMRTMNLLQKPPDSRSPARPHGRQFVTAPSGKFVFAPVAEVEGLPPRRIQPLFRGWSCMWASSSKAA